MSTERATIIRIVDGSWLKSHSSEIPIKDQEETMQEDSILLGIFVSHLHTKRHTTGDALPVSQKRVMRSGIFIPSPRPFTTSYPPLLLHDSNDPSVSNAHAAEACTSSRRPSSEDEQEASRATTATRTPHPAARASYRRTQALESQYLLATRHAICAAS